MTFAKLIKSSSLLLLLTIASTSNAFSTSGSSSLSSSSSGKSSSDLGSSESRSFTSHANSGDASSAAAASTAALYSLSKAMANALAASRHSAEASASAASQSASSPSHASSASNIEESSEEYVPKRKTVILAIPVKLALQQAAAAAAIANERPPSVSTSLAHLPSSASYEEHAQVNSPTSYAKVNSNGNAGATVYSSVSNAPQQQAQLISYAPQSYQVQSVATASPAPINVRQPVVYSTAPAPSAPAYAASAPAAPASASHQPERPTYTDKSPAKYENEVDSSYVESSGSTYSGNAQSYENASPVVRSRAPSAAPVDPSDYETEEVPVSVAPVRKAKKSKPVYYLEEQGEGDDSYITLPKSYKAKSSPYAASSASLEGLSELDAYSTASGLRNAAAGFSDEDYASALSGASSLYPQSAGDLSSFYPKSSRHNSPYIPSASAYSQFAGLSAPPTGYPRPSSYGYPRSASSLRPLYSPVAASPFSTSSAHFKPTYSGSPFSASSASRMYLPSASSPYKSYFSAGSSPFASSSQYGSLASASSPSSSASSPFASSSSPFSSMSGLRIGGANGISVGAGNKGVRIGPLEFSSAGSSIFPTIKIKAPARSAI